VNEPPNSELMKLTLQAAVPLWIEKVRHYSDAQRTERAGLCAQVIAEKGDVLQYGGKGAGKAFNALAEGLACLAFAPGGVKFAGMHWEAKS